MIVTLFVPKSESADALDKVYSADTASSFVGGNAVAGGIITATYDQSNQRLMLRTDTSHDPIEFCGLQSYEVLQAATKA